MSIAETSLPHNTEAEKTILGAILLDENAIIEASTILEADGLEVNATIWLH